jgi:stage II sporulation SpoAA-like protein
MLKELPGMPSGVIGFEVSGTVRAEDYRDVVIPALERAASEGDVRFVVEMPEFKGMTPGALWQDLKVAAEHLGAMKRIAVVTDIEWVGQMMGLFGWLIPSEMRTFPMAQRDDALKWIAS